MASASPGGVVPAQLGFLAIFNPSLGNTDETIDDQIVYYASVSTLHPKRRRRSRAKPTQHVSQEERNERLRQIGLAQGMVDFGKSFSGGTPVDTIDTEKSRVVLHELESGWWILASIDLTRLPLPPKLPTGKTGEPPKEVVEYSSKEIKPARLLLQDLLRAHSTFLLHHGFSLSSLFVRSRRSKFVSILGRYWDLYLSTWNVMLHGNPVRNVFGGINVAASGELGIGVGEEERGSGEREVLEGLVGRIEGLVDLVVCKFGSYDPEGGEATTETSNDPKQPWLGTGEDPGPEDGAIFLGTGALSRKSLKDVTHWMEDLYTWGPNAYGIIESPTSIRRARKARRSIPPDARSHEPSDPPVRPPIRPQGSGSSKSIKTLAERRGQPIGTVAEARTPDATTPPTGEADVGSGHDDGGNLDKIMNYMKLGYGTYWSIGKSDRSPEHTGPARPDAAPTSRPGRTPVDEAAGHYLIGLMGHVEESGVSEADEDGPWYDLEESGNSRTMLRTVHVELEQTERHLSESKAVRDLGSLVNDVTPLGGEQPPAAIFEGHDQNKANKLRVVVYVNRPFIFAFLFELTTDSLAWEPLYRSLHYQLAPLRKPLLASTSYRPERPHDGTSGADIYNLVWDPAALTVHSTIPSIPDPTRPLATDAAQPPWSRADATNTHVQLLNVYGVTRTNAHELERTCKTNRGWWIVWTRIVERPPLPSPGGDGGAWTDQGEDDSGSKRKRSDGKTDRRADDEAASSSAAVSDGSSGASQSSTERTHPSTTGTPRPTVSKEVFLVRRAGDHSGLRGRSASHVEGGGGWADGAGKLAHGIGVDTKKYIEGLLSLDR